MVKKEKFSFLLTIFKSESDVNCDSWKHAWVYLVLSTGSKVRIKIEAKDIPPNKKERGIIKCKREMKIREIKNKEKCKNIIQKCEIVLVLLFFFLILKSTPTRLQL